MLTNTKTVSQSLRLYFMFFLGMPCCLFASASGQAQRIDTYAQALTNATGDQAIAVLLHGSDWCVAGDKLKQNTWDRSAFEQALGSEFMLMDIDHPEGRDRAPLRSGLFDLHQQARTIRKLQVTSTGGVTFTPQADGSFLASGENPAKDTLKLEFNTGAKPVTALLIEFLTHKTLPKSGPGRRTGNIVLSEVESTILSGESPSPLKWSFALADREQNGWPVSATIDGNSDDNSGWSLNRGQLHSTAQLLLFPEEPSVIPANTSLSIQLNFVSKNRQYTPGCIRLGVVNTPVSAKTKAEWVKSEAERKYYEEAARDCPAKSSNYPAVLLFDGDGNAIGGLHAIAHDQTASALASDLKSLKDEHDSGRALLREAKGTTGRAKAEKLGEALVLLKYQVPRKNYRHPFEDSFQELKAADPNDISGYTAKFSYSTTEIKTRLTELLKADQFEEAKRVVKLEMDNPKHGRVASHMWQDLYLHLYKSTKDKDVRKFALQKMVILDPESDIGVGAKGWLCKRYAEGPPTFAYGWMPRHIKPGRNKLVFEHDTNLHIEYDGWNCILLKLANDSDPLTVHGVAIELNGARVEEYKHTAHLTKEGEKFYLNIPTRKPDDVLAVVVDYEASAGEKQSSGSITVTPYFPWELPAGVLGK